MNDIIIKIKDAAAKHNRVKIDAWYIDEDGFNEHTYFVLTDNDVNNTTSNYERVIDRMNELQVLYDKVTGFDRPAAGYNRSL